MNTKLFTILSVVAMVCFSASVVNAEEDSPLSNLGAANTAQGSTAAR